MGVSQPILVFFVVTSGLLLVTSSVKLLYIPLAIAFEIRRGTLFRAPGRPVSTRRHLPSRIRSRPQAPGVHSVSVIVPAYNEGIVLANCVESILRTAHSLLEIIIVDDGSTDDTALVMAELARKHPVVQAVSQVNGGKGAALNHGIALAHGSVLVFVDADGIFAPTTIPYLLRALSHPPVGAVCGDDRPVNLDRVQTRMLSVISHVGTGLVRRALSVLHCLPIVSGNIGAFRADLVRQIGGFRTDTVGEDLELTWRIYRAGYRVQFEPRALVLAESPSTVRGLWRQRVRWARGLLQTVKHHRRMIGNPNYGVFGIFLAFNTLTMVIGPILQLLALTAFAVLLPLARVQVGPDVLAIAGWLGIFVTLTLVLLSLALNGSWRDLAHLWTLPLWPLYSLFVGLTMATAMAKELKGRPAEWNKLNRTGVVSTSALQGALADKETV